VSDGSDAATMIMAGDKGTLLFRRDFQGLTGGHLKVWHYFGHSTRSSRFTPRIHLTPLSTRGADNPWNHAVAGSFAAWEPTAAAALFVAGLDWEAVPDPCPVPVVNLIQHVRHAHAGDPRRRFLPRPAVRICVSEEVADAIRSTREVNGPVVAIPNGIDLENIPAAATRDVPVLIAGLKNPPFAAALGERLRAAGLVVEVVSDLRPRGEFLELLSRARVAVTLPTEDEGFFLPALEAMAAGAIVVCPDCVGNRGFCLDGVTCLRPSYTLEAVAEAALRAATLPPAAAADMLAAAGAQARGHGLERERTAFLEILDAL